MLPAVKRKERCQYFPPSFDVLIPPPPPYLGVSAKECKMPTASRKRLLVRYA